MDWLTFIAAVIGAIAWPLVALIALLLFNRHLPTIGQMVTKVKYKDVEVEFGKAVANIANEVEAFFPELDSVVANPSSIQVTSANIDNLDEIAKLSHRAAIIEAWGRVDMVSTEVLQNIPRPWNHPWHLKLISEEFVDQGVLTQKQADIYREMQLLKYAVERYEAKDINDVAVRKYIRSASMLVSHLSSFLVQHGKQSLSGEK